MTTPSIRDARREDAAEIARLAAQLGYPASAPQMDARLQRLLQSSTHFVAVAGEGTLLGWAAGERRLLLESGDRVELIGLVVDATARRSGVGRELVCAVERWAIGQQVGTVFLRSNVMRAESHSFYEHVGYVRTKTQHAYRKVLPMA